MLNTIRKKRPEASRWGQGYDSGYTRGYDKAYQIGWNSGAASFTKAFSGTSIVIATYNQKDLLKKCVDSIKAHTPEPHEMIIIDNGSEDGTSDYLRSLGGSIRYRRNTTNLGYAGGVNQGLMMARGDTIVILDHDTTVTERWLTNLLACLRHYPQGALVGPVTNSARGDQQIGTTYRSLEDMHHFAASYNVSDREKWRTAGRMNGYAVMMSKDTFNRLGYLDEGFEFGSGEDDDFSLRATLLGIELVVAGDTFIHHAGGAALKEPGEPLETVYGNNLAFYSRKWGDIRSLPEHALPQLEESVPGSLCMTTYYPSYVLVKGPGPTVYWLEDGCKHPVTGNTNAGFARLSQTDLRHYPTAAKLSAEELEIKLATLGSTSSRFGPIAEGVLLKASDGTVYQSDRGTLRPVVGDRALASWHLDRRAVYPVSEEVMALYPVGVPIISPAVLRSANL